MMKRYVSLFILLLLATGTFAQKVKYKDLFVLLDSRRFTDAEPFLRKYIKDNTDNPNAHLFMGFLLQEKCQKADVLKETPAVLYLADSAVLYLELAKKGITEKEIKRNDEYYQSYSRRNQRTGEFGIALSDVQIDIDDRIAALKTRKQKVNILKNHFDEWARLYQRSANLFKSLQGAYPGEKEFLLQSDENSIAKLSEVIQAFDSCQSEYKSYRTALEQVNKPGYAQNFNARRIEKFKDDGQGTPDFFSDDVKGWNYGDWALAHIQEIQREVIPFRDKLVSYDVEINKLFDRIRKDSSSVTNLIPAVEEKIKVNPVARFDASPMPLMVFKMKLEELKFTSFHIDNRKLRDSTNINVKMQTIKSELASLTRLDSIAGILVAKDIDKETENYQHFVTNAYGSTKMLKSLISATKEFSEHEKHRREDVIQRLSNSLNWLVVDVDSVAIGQVKQRKPNHFPLAIYPERFMSGLKFGADSVATGFFYTITPSRKPDLKASFPVDKVIFAKKNLPLSKSLSVSNEGGTVFYTVIYSETKVGDKFPVNITRVNKPEGMVWNLSYKFEFLPSELVVSPDTGDLTIKITSPGGDSKLITLDKAGKQL